jgi:hypothetical protein
MRLSRTTLPFALATFVIALAPGASSAATVQRVIGQLANGLCGANNPANDPSLRRLLTGLRNVGTSNVSVVCSQWGDDYSTLAATSTVVYLRNDKATGANATCILAMGTPFHGQVTVTKTIYVAAGVAVPLSWTTVDYGTNVDMQFINLQCSLPPGFTMQEIGLQYDENIGT